MCHRGGARQCSPISGIHGSMISFLVGLLLLLPAPTKAGACEGPTDCGIEEAIIPDFALVDQNTRSATSGRTISRDELLGEVLLIYWAQAT